MCELKSQKAASDDRAEERSSPGTVMVLVGWQRELAASLREWRDASEPALQLDDMNQS
jgi:hypothetical protein